MTAPAAPRGSNGHRGGGHGLSAGRRGARHEGPRSHPASPGGQADVDPGRRHPGPQPAQHPAAAAGSSSTYGYDGLFDRRRRTPSPKRAPVAEVQRLLALYRERYQGFNVRHFHQLARRQHGVRFCYAFVKKALQSAGLVAKHRPRGRHRRRREPRPCFGELLHLDGSRHHWLALVPGAVVHADRRRRRRHQAAALRPARARAARAWRPS